MLTSWSVKEELIMMKGGWICEPALALASQAWRRVLVTVILEEEMALVHRFVTTW